MRKSKMKSFDILGLNPILMDKIEVLGLIEPTPIQYKAIPHVLNGRDVMGLAQTGTGKTAAFVLPIAHRLMENRVKPLPKSTHALILAPTRELAKQIQEAIKSFVRGSPIRVGMVVGGLSINPQIHKLQKGMDILVATPGRLIDLLDRRAVTLEHTHYLVLDEADQMLDLGFIHALRQISKLLPIQKQTMLFSATMPKLMSEIADTYLNQPIRIEVSPPGKVADKITQFVHFVTQGDKPDLLKKLLSHHQAKRSLVFSRTKHGADRIVRNLKKKHIGAAAIHGDKAQNQRQKALQAFKDSKIRVLVATDIAARGIDIDKLSYVLNYDIPNESETYVHRIGRCGRAGEKGVSISICEPEENAYSRNIEKLIKQKIEEVKNHPFPQTEKPMDARQKKEFEKEKQRKKQEFFANRNKKRNANKATHRNKRK